MRTNKHTETNKHTSLLVGAWLVTQPLAMHFTRVLSLPPPLFPSLTEIHTPSQGVGHTHLAGTGGAISGCTRFAQSYRRRTWLGHRCLTPPHSRDTPLVSLVYITTRPSAPPPHPCPRPLSLTHPSCCLPPNPRYPRPCIAPRVDTEMEDAMAALQRARSLEIETVLTIARVCFGEDVVDVSALMHLRAKANSVALSS